MRCTLTQRIGRTGACPHRCRSWRPGRASGESGWRTSASGSTPLSADTREAPITSTLQTTIRMQSKHRWWRSNDDKGISTTGKTHLLWTDDASADAGKVNSAGKICIGSRRRTTERTQAHLTPARLEGCDEGAGILGARPHCLRPPLTEQARHGRLVRQAEVARVLLSVQKRSTS